MPVLAMRLAAPAHLVDINRVTELDTVDGHRRRRDGRRAGPARPGRARRGARRVAAAAAAGAAAGRPPDHPQPRHHGRFPRARRPGRRDDGGAGAVPGHGHRGLRRGTPDDRRLPTSSSARWSRRSVRTSWRSARTSRRCRPAPVPRSSRSPAGTAITRCAGSAPSPNSTPAGALARLRCAYLSVADVPAGARPHRRPGGPVDGTDAADAGPATRSTRQTDLHATADYRRHLAGVLTIRAARQAISAAQRGGRRSMSEPSRHRLDVTVDGERRRTRPPPGRRRRTLSRLPAARPGSHRHPRRLRARGLRRLHGAARRRAGPLLPDLRGHPWPATRSPPSRGSAGRTQGGRRCRPVQRAFRECHALQCGFCTPGFLTTITAGLADEPGADPGRRPSR